MSETNEMLSAHELYNTVSSLAEMTASEPRAQRTIGGAVGWRLDAGETSPLDAGLARFLGGSVFTVGLMLVIIPGSELFTGNILMTVGFLGERVKPLRIMRRVSCVACAPAVGLRSI